MTSRDRPSEPSSERSPARPFDAGPVLVFGATGILRPAVAELARRGATVLAVARSWEDLDRLAREHSGTVVPVAVDHGDVAALLAAVRGAGSPASALAYAPHGDERTWQALRLLVAGPVVQLLTTVQFAPVAGDAERLPARPGCAGDWHRLLLGWTRDRSWHTPAQVSLAALAALDGRRDGILGSVRPWSDRPVA